MPGTVRRRIPPDAGIVKLRHGRLQIEDQVQRLGQDDAIEGGRGQHARFGQVADDRRGVIRAAG
jgi:hypothetical protein